MPSLDISIPHQLSQDEALNRIKRLLSEAKRDHGDKITELQESWDGNTGTFSFSAKGYDVSGSLEVHPNTIELRSKVPFAVSLFKGVITSMITQKAKELLA
jgi:Putative polyhydroxyalkanoic acid system protein (PHA_gran_rgn)